MQKSDFWTRITSLYGTRTWPVVLYMYNSGISTRLYRFQPSSVVSCIQNSGLMTTIACVNGTQTSPVIFGMQNSMPSIIITSLYGSQPSSVVFGCKTATFGPEYQISMGPRYHLSFCSFNAAWLAPELLVSSSMGPSHYLWFFIQNGDFCTRITSLYVSQTSPVVLWMQTSVISTRITSLYGSQPTAVVIACKTATFNPNRKSLWVPGITCRFVPAMQRD